MQREPFADETVERRQRGDGQRADEKTERGQRHPFDQAAELVHVARAGLRFHRAHAEKQQRFVKRMIDQMIQRRDKGDGRQRRMIRRDENHSRAEAGDDDADVFNRTVRQHDFEVVVRGRIKNPDQRGKRSDDQREQARPGVRRRHEVGIHAQNSVKAEIQRRARQHRHKRARRGDIGARQPEIHRHESGLHAEAEKRKQENRPLHAGAQTRRRRFDRTEIQRTGANREQKKTQRRRERSGFAHRQQKIARTGMAIFLFPRADDEQLAKDGHDFPREQEQHGIARNENQGDGRIKPEHHHGERASRRSLRTLRASDSPPAKIEAGKSTRPVTKMNTAESESIFNVSVAANPGNVHSGWLNSVTRQAARLRLPKSKQSPRGNPATPARCPDATGAQPATAKCPRRTARKKSR